MKINITLTFFFLYLSILHSNAQIIKVTNTSELSTALNNAKAGTIIQLEDGLYQKSGGFKTPTNIHGTSENPIIIQGTKNAILSSGNLTSGNGFSLSNNNYWHLEGFTIYNSKKGIVTDNCNFCEFNNLSVLKVGDEAIHLRTYSCNNMIINCYIDSTGANPTSASAGFAEGIYIGSANSNWATYTNGNPDACNFNLIKNNTFGNHILSENIDIKEGTKGGLIYGNQFNGLGCNGKNSADSWVDVKGNSYTIACNTGKNVYPNGNPFQTHIVWPNTGDSNTFKNNTIEMNFIGDAIMITTSSSKGVATNNKVCNSNLVTPETSTISNIATVSCIDNCETLTNLDLQNELQKNCFVFPNPVQETINLNQVFESIVLLDVYNTPLIEQKNTNTISTQNLPSGSYLLVVQNEEKYQFIKIFKE